MDNLDTTVDIAHDDVRAGRTRAADPGSPAEGPPGRQRPDGGAGWPLLSPTMRGALAGNPLRVRL